MRALLTAYTHEKTKANLPEFRNYILTPPTASVVPPVYPSARYQQSSRKKTFRKSGNTSHRLTLTGTFQTCSEVSQRACSLPCKFKKIGHAAGRTFRAGRELRRDRGRMLRRSRLLHTRRGPRWRPRSDFDERRREIVPCQLPRQPGQRPTL